MDTHGPSLQVGSWNIRGIYACRNQNLPRRLQNRYPEHHLKKIQPIVPDTPNIKDYLRGLPLDILAIIETHLKPNSIQEGLQIVGFFTERFDRTTNTSGGGLLTYFREGVVQLEPRIITKQTSSDLQYMHFVLKEPLKFSLVVVYHPAANEEMIYLLKYYLLCWTQHPIVFIGDFNPNKKCKKQFNDLWALGLRHLLTNEPTFYRGRKGRCTDNIFTNIPECPENFENLCTSDRAIVVEEKSIRNSNRLKRSKNAEKPEFPCVSDHELIWCKIRKHDAKTKQDPIKVQCLLQYPFDSQSNLPVEVKNWIEKNRVHGDCVLALNCQFLNAPDQSILKSTKSVKTIRKKKTTIVMVTAKIGQEQDVESTLEEFKDVLKNFRPKPVVRQCILLKTPTEISEHLSSILNATDNPHCSPIDHFSLCDEATCFSIRKTAEQHILHHKHEHGLKAETCGYEYENQICYQKFDTEIACLLHIHETHDGSPYKQCRFDNCLQVFHEDGENHHTSKVHKMFVCDYTGSECLGFKFRHQADAHECPMCPQSKNKSLCSQKAMNKHLKEAHKIKPKVKTCEKCYKTCNSKHTYEQHTKWCGNEKPFQCHNCLKECMSEESYKKHFVWCSGDTPFRCTRCQKEYVNEGSYKKHIDWCGGDKPFRCKRCQKEYVNEGSYKKHIAWCGGNKPFLCPVCGKGYQYKSTYYKKHVKQCKKK